MKKDPQVANPVQYWKERMEFAEFYGFHPYLIYVYRRNYLRAKGEQ